jgi:signal transduction histidine kinase
VRSHRALAAETADRLRLAEEENEAEAARMLAEERLRIARELHDTVAHSMATITVQAGSALHLLPDPAAGGASGPRGRPARQARDALIVIRDTSKQALAEIRVTVGQLRDRGAQADVAEARAAGLDRLDALADAVRAAGAPVSVTIEGEQQPLPPGVDHAAYRILQESLTNVLRHAGPDASAAIRLRYAGDALTIRVTNDGADRSGDSRPVSNGHGLTGMAERAAAVGGRLAGARPGASRSSPSFPSPRPSRHGDQDPAGRRSGPAAGRLSHADRVGAGHDHCRRGPERGPGGGPGPAVQ